MGNLPCRIGAFTVVAVLACVVLLRGQCISRPGMRAIESFSSLAIVGGLQGPSGIEMILKENGNHVDAVLRDYAGDVSAEETKLTGNLREQTTEDVATCAVTLTGTNKHGAVRIRGVINPSGFSGTIERSIGHDHYSHKFSLRRRLPEDTSEKKA